MIYVYTKWTSTFYTSTKISIKKHHQSKLTFTSSDPLWTISFCHSASFCLKELPSGINIKLQCGLQKVLESIDSNNDDARCLYKGYDGTPRGESANWVWWISIIPFNGACIYNQTGPVFLGSMFLLESYWKFEYLPFISLFRKAKNIDATDPSEPCLLSYY